MLSGPALDGRHSGPLPNTGSAEPAPPLIAIPSTFDLTSVEEALWRVNRRIRGQLGVLYPLMAVVVTLGILAAPGPVGSRRFVIELVEGILTAAILLGFGLVLGLRIWRRGPQRVTVTEAGLELGYSSNQVERLVWRDPRLRLDINDFRSSSIPLRKEMPCDVSIGSLGLRKFSVTANATDAMTQAALPRAGGVYLRNFEVFGDRVCYWTIRGNARSSPGNKWTRVNPR